MPASHSHYIDDAFLCNAMKSLELRAASSRQCSLRADGPKGGQL